MNFSFDDVVRATGGSPTRELGADASLCISTDTRALEPGDAFLALKGETFDGHDFVGDAFAKGAALAIVSRADAIPSGRAGLVVSDTLAAYMALAAEARVRVGGTLIAITGSTGKTTTKSLLAQLLTLCGNKVAATPQNENNEIGVSKLLLGLEGDETFMIVEMGARHPGDIAQLVKIAQPQMGILTNVGEAHLEIFGTREALADTKWGLFATGCVGLLNVGDEESLRRAHLLANGCGWFGAGAAARSATDDQVPAALIPQRETLVFADGASRDAYSIKSNLPGDHNLSNLAAAIVAARALEMQPQAIVDAIPLLVLPPGRYERIALERGVQVIYDAYNASLSGTVATLHAFSAEPAQRRIAILGGMAELGEESPQFHEQAGAAVRRYGIDLLLAGGAHADSTVRGALEAGMPESAVLPYKDNSVAVAWLRDNLREGDCVLLKGSRMYKMEEILGALQ
jgi:UDP-N-acetylmuramoyl-tripeptide--D-alanyl-D-alanine ligase